MYYLDCHDVILRNVEHFVHFPTRATSYLTQVLKIFHFGREDASVDVQLPVLLDYLLKSFAYFFTEENSKISVRLVNIKIIH